MEEIVPPKPKPTHAHSSGQPQDAIASCLLRVYHSRLTTTSGGNVSILDRTTNTLFVTPKGTDKGNITREQILYCDPKTLEWKTSIPGLLPSTEHGFHAAIYQSRTDICAVLHAHAPCLVSYAICCQSPPSNILSRGSLTLGTVMTTPYKLPGSQQLIKIVSDAFSKDISVHCVILNNHGIIIAANDLQEAYCHLEIAETCAAIGLRSRMLMNGNPPKELTQTQISRLHSNINHVRSHCQSSQLHKEITFQITETEKELRSQMTQIIKRALQQKLFGSWFGTISARLTNDLLLISPSCTDRQDICSESFVTVKITDEQLGHFNAVYNDSENSTKGVPSLSIFNHIAIYKYNPDVNFIISSDSLINSMAFSVASSSSSNTSEVPKLHSELIPEGYIVLRNVKVLPFEASLEPERLAKSFNQSNNPVVIIQNDSVYATGKTWLSAFDRLEVLETMAEAQINATASHIGKINVITGQDITDIEKAFF